MADLIDPTHKANYPVILSDRLLGKEHNEIFTGVRCKLLLHLHSFHHHPSTPSDTRANTDNHKPSFPTESSRARLKPSTPGQTTSYDLNFSGSDGRTDYAFTGTRVIGDGRYVLYFDPKREAFILDRMDSTFHMNITRTPGNSDPESLRQKYPHISDSPLSSAATGPASRAAAAESSSSSSSRPLAKAKQPRAKSPIRKKEPAARKPEKKAAAAQKTKAKPKNINLALPQASDPEASSKTAKSTKPKTKSRQADEEDEDEDEGDDLLLVEYPGGGGPKTQARDFSPAFPSVKPFDEYMDQRESEADDADGESESDMDWKLPSPAGHHGAAAAGHSNQSRHQEQDDDEEEEEPEFMDVDVQPEQGRQDAAGSPNLEDDLEKDLEEAFEAVNNSNNGSPRDGDESEISEED